MKKLRKRHDWSYKELEDLYSQPLFNLIAHAHEILKRHHQLGDVQVCSLISIKTGGCPEDCKWCSQSSHYKTAVSAQPLMPYEQVIERAKKAVCAGATRICLGAAWRGVRDSAQFDEVLKMIKKISSMGVEVCCTLGALKEHQAQKLKEAGLFAYNHNLESSESYYKTVVTTHTYEDRLKTLGIARAAGLTTCCGGIVGMGEKVSDRLELLRALTKQNPHPESVPINLLAQIKGTPLENKKDLSFWELIRMVAVARIALPLAVLRLSAGRERLSIDQQMLCFFAGINSIHSGEKLLTIGNIPFDQDSEMFEILGLKKRAPFAKSTY